MKKLLMFGFALGACLIGNAQAVTESAVIIDAAEDTTQVNTINDIVVMQEKVSSRNITDAHYSKVWSRKSFFNPGYVSSNVTSEGEVALANGVKEKLSFKHDWGAQIQLGHRYTLHRGAIANMVQINLDVTYLDLTVDHYKEDSAFSSYQSDQKWKDSPGIEAPFHMQPDYQYPEDETKAKKVYDSGFEYLPWGADKYSATIGMSIGPSITVAPFTLLHNKGLDFIKLNAYYHFGYNAGGLMMDQKDGGLFDYFVWGLGRSNTFGLSLSWKSIGIGWETRSLNIKYKPGSTGEYGDFNTKLKNSSSRIYLSINY